VSTLVTNDATLSCCGALPGQCNCAAVEEARNHAQSLFTPEEAEELRRLADDTSLTANQFVEQLNARLTPEQLAAINNLVRARQEQHVSTGTGYGGPGGSVPTVAVPVVNEAISGAPLLSPVWGANGPEVPETTAAVANVLPGQEAMSGDYVVDVVNGQLRMVPVQRVAASGQPQPVPVPVYNATGQEVPQSVSGEPLVAPAPPVNYFGAQGGPAPALVANMGAGEALHSMEAHEGQLLAGQGLLHLGDDQRVLLGVEELGGGDVRVLVPDRRGGSGPVHIRDVLRDPRPLLVREFVWAAPP
jgi:hypothetical protein